jgi:hypothetical protein
MVIADLVYAGEVTSGATRAVRMVQSATNTSLIAGSVIASAAS